MPRATTLENTKENTKAFGRYTLARTKVDQAFLELNAIIAKSVLSPAIDDGIPQLNHSSVKVTPV